MIDFFFMLDLVMNFRTSIIKSTTNEEITDLRVIAINYLKGRFWIDLLASFPLDSVTFIFLDSNSGSTLWQLFGLLKLVRILRLSRLIAYLNIKNDLKMSLKLVKLVFFLVLYLHILGCMWFFIAKQDDKWIPPLDYVYVTTDLYEKNRFSQYCSSIYHALLMLGGNDIGPRGEFQILFVTLMLLIASIVNANIFGNIIVLIQSMNRKATVFQEKIDYAVETMKNLKVPDRLQEDVKKYITYTSSTEDYQNEYDRFLGMLSPSLKQQVNIHIFHNAISQNHVFKDYPDYIEIMLRDLETRFCLPEDIIIRQNDIAQ